MPSTRLAPAFPVHYRIRLALEVAGLEPEAAAEQLGLHVNTIYNWLSGRRPPRRVSLMAIAEVTGVPLWWLEGHDTESEEARGSDAAIRGYTELIAA